MSLLAHRVTQASWPTRSGRSNCRQPAEVIVAAYRDVAADEPEERVDRDHALIQRRGRVLALLLEILEEFPDHVRRDVFDGQVGRVDPMALHHKSEEESHPDNCVGYCG
jgi:hypothetical protein